MDEYHCKACPIFIATTDFDPENSSCPDDQYFNVEVEYTNVYVLNARNFETYCDTTYHNFHNISKDKMLQEEATIVSWLSNMGMPKDCYKLVVTNILDCANHMVNRTHKHQKVLSMRACVVITRANEDGTDEEEEDDDDFEEEEEVEDEDEDHGLVPATKSSIEGLEMVNVEEGCEQRRCAICFEDFIVGVRMPCLHMFHRGCINGWLQVGSFCPLCRFQMPTIETE